MHRSDLALAALSTAAVPGLRAVEVHAMPADGDDDVALVVDDERRRWIVRSPRDAAAGARLEAEAALLRSLAGRVTDGALPFAVPSPAGFAALDEGGRAVVYPEIPGTPLRADLLRPGPGLARALGRAVAALHELPASLVEDAGLPSYSAEEYRQRRLAELDEAAATGRVPVRLLRRWEAALEDVAVWRFRPVVTHGDLGTEHVLTAQQSVNGIVDWSSCQVADPADDLAQLVVVAPPDAVESVLEAYRMGRTELTDTHLVERAHLASELALVRWLLHGVHQGSRQIQDDAVEMMTELDVTVHPDGAEPASPSARLASSLAGATRADAVPVEATELADGTSIVRTGPSAASARSAATGAVPAVDGGDADEGFGHEGFGHEGFGHEGFGHEGAGPEGLGGEGLEDAAFGGERDDDGRDDVQDRLVSGGVSAAEHDGRATAPRLPTAATEAISVVDAPGAWTVSPASAVPSGPSGASAASATSVLSAEDGTDDDGLTGDEPAGDEPADGAGR